MRNSKGQFLKGNIHPFKGTKGLKKATSGSFKKGQVISPDTQFKKGQNKANKNVNWKGDNVGYYALHMWLRREYGNPLKCDECGKTKNIQWANKSYKYLRDRDDWMQLCQKCHFAYDNDNWGIATILWNLNK